MRLESFLARLREAHPDMETIFRRGSCYHLWLIVREALPDVECWYDSNEGHVYLKHEGRFYDIRGRLNDTRGTNLAPLDHKRGHRPHRWSSASSSRLSSSAS